MFIITGRAVVAEGNRKRFLEIAEAQTRASRMEAGCLEYGFYEDGMVPGQFLFVEKWKDQAAIDFHFKQPYCLEFISEAGKLSTDEPDISIFEVQSQRAVEP